MGALGLWGFDSIRVWIFFSIEEPGDSEQMREVEASQRSRWTNLVSWAVERVCRSAVSDVVSEVSLVLSLGLYQRDLDGFVFVADSQPLCLNLY